MSGLAFFDTNILLYADDMASPAKQERAIRLIAEHRRKGSMVLSLQVLQEYFVAATRKLGVDPELAQRKVELLAAGHVIRFQERDVVAAIELHRLNRISFWEAMIVHAARLAGAALIYTEDLQHGASLAGIPVSNPFLSG